MEDDAFVVRIEFSFVATSATQAPRRGKEDPPHGRTAEDGAESGLLWRGSPSTMEETATDARQDRYGRPVFLGLVSAGTFDNNPAEGGSRPATVTDRDPTAEGNDGGFHDNDAEWK